MTRAEKVIKDHIEKANGLTSPGIASLITGFSIVTCKRVFKKLAKREDNGTWFLQ